MIPVTEFPHVGAKTTRTRFEHEHLIQHAFVHRRRLGGIPSKHAFSERNAFEVEVVVHGVIMEVVVLATVVEVVAHVRFRRGT